MLASPIGGESHVPREEVEQYLRERGFINLENGTWKKASTTIHLSKASSCSMAFFHDIQKQLETPPTSLKGRGKVLSPHNCSGLKRDPKAPAINRGGKRVTVGAGEAKSDQSASGPSEEVIVELWPTRED